MPQVLRDYQLDAVAGLRAEIRRGKRSILLVAPTGSGKTSIAAHMIFAALAKGKRILFLAHRLELINQASARLDDLGVDHGVIMADHPRKRPWLHVQVASVPTLVRRLGRVLQPDRKMQALENLAERPGTPSEGEVAAEMLKRYKSARGLFSPDLIFIDECHRSRGQSYATILAAYPSAICIGLTATPIRSDGRGLGELFDAMVECPGIGELTAMGHLVPSRVYAPSAPDLKGVKTKAGDWDHGGLSLAMDKTVLIGDIVSHWLELAKVEGETEDVGMGNDGHNSSVFDRRNTGVPAQRSVEGINAGTHEESKTGPTSGGAGTQGAPSGTPRASAGEVRLGRGPGDGDYSERADNLDAGAATGKGGGVDGRNGGYEPDHHMPIGVGRIDRLMGTDDTVRIGKNTTLTHETQGGTVDGKDGAVLRDTRNTALVLRGVSVDMDHSGQARFHPSAPQRYRPTVAFAVSIDHSEHICEQFRAAGVRAEHLDGKTPDDERRGILARLASGETQVVTSVGVLTEGWDCPVVSCAILARPTQSLGLYLQMVGRILRPAPGKSDALVIDHSGMVHRHGFPDDEREWTLDKDKDVREVQKKKKGVKACLSCWMAMPSDAAVCPGCGADQHLARPVEVREGTLEEVKRRERILECCECGSRWSRNGFKCGACGGRMVVPRYDVLFAARAAWERI